MNAASVATIVILVLACAAFLAVVERMRSGVRRRIGQRLGQSVTAAPTLRPFWQSFLLNLLFVSVLAASVLATQQFME